MTETYHELQLSYGNGKWSRLGPKLTSRKAATNQLAKWRTDGHKYRVVKIEKTTTVLDC